MDFAIGKGQVTLVPSSFSLDNRKNLKGEGGGGGCQSLPVW